jgi:D-inositol-3-phosphate glycosyltransferase
MRRTLVRARVVLARSAGALLVTVRASRRIRPRRCVGAVQAPRQLPADVVEVRGWAWFERDDLASCCVTVDGHVAAAAELGPAALDVACARPETAQSSRCSWRAEVDLSRHTDRSVVIGAIVTSERGVAQHLSAARVAVVPVVGRYPRPGRTGRQGRIERPGGIEQPGPGATVPAGRVHIAGWALADAALPGRLEVRVNGRDAGLARVFAAARPDVAAQYRDPVAPVAGFDHVVTVEGRPGKLVRLDADLIPVGGRRVSLQGVDVRVAPPPPPPSTSASATSRSEVLAALHPITAEAAAATGHLRVVAFTHSLQLGGGELYLQELLRDLLKNANVSCLVVTAQDGPLRDELETLGAVVHVTDYPFPDTAAYEARTVELAGLVCAYRAQVIIVNTLISALGADVARRLDLPAVWAIHESYTLEDYWVATCGDERAPALAAANAVTLADTTAVLFEADATRAVYARTVSGERLATLHYGIDLDAIRAFATATHRADARRSTGFADDSVVLACVGNFEPRKAQAALATAFAVVADEFPNARLALVGQNDTTYARGVEELVARLGLGERIQVRPAEPNPYRWYRAADGFVAASDLESMPRVLLEAMAFGLPVVAADVWGIPELVHHGENGLLVPPRDVEALAEALRSFLRLTPSERTRLGEAGSRLVHDRHDLAGYRRVFEQLLRRLIADPQAPMSTLLAP